MRVKLGIRIYSCTCATFRNEEDSHIILLTTPNGVYTVDMKTNLNASSAHKQLLCSGYYDFSNYEYSN